MAKSVSNHQEPVVVAVPVDPDHPLLKLKEILPWNQLYSIAHSAWRKNGKNVDHGKGRKWDLRLYLMIIVLKIILGLNSRQMEDNLAENAVTRMFIEYEDYPEPQIRDHSNIARAEESLGEDVLCEINAIILRLAVEYGFADRNQISADTTVQEAAIGYPNEPGLRLVEPTPRRAF